MGVSGNAYVCKPGGLTTLHTYVNYACLHTPQWVCKLVLFTYPLLGVASLGCVNITITIYIPFTYHLHTVYRGGLVQEANLAILLNTFTYLCKHVWFTYHAKGYVNAPGLHRYVNVVWPCAPFTDEPIYIYIVYYVLFYYIIL